MRERLILFAVLVAAAGLAALLVLPRGKLPPPEPPAEEPLEPLPSKARVPAPLAARDAGLSSIDAGPPPLPSYVHVDPRSPAECGPGMVLVDGMYCPYVGYRCLDWVNEPLDICARYGPDVICEGALEKRAFCIDVFEYPNLDGVVPAVMASYRDAERACEVEGKRLCRVAEWEMACEGSQMWPYPYGTERDADACNIDREGPSKRSRAARAEHDLEDPWKVSDEVERVDRRAASGSSPRCISPHGVRDLTGNVEEWVDDPLAKAMNRPFRSALEGGGAGRSKARCRAADNSHDRGFSSPEVGFRCCRDAKTSPPESPAGGVTMPRVHRMPDPPARPTP